MSINRRELLRLSGAFCAAFSTRAFAQQPGSLASFDALLNQTLDDEALISAGRTLREGPSVYFQEHLARGRPRTKPSKRPISDRAKQMIVAFEVTSEKQYELKYQGAIWPHGASGITIGIGYDIGYVNKSWLKDDWIGLIDDSQIELLSTACELTGDEARDTLPRFGSVKIPWAIAYKQFADRVLPLYIAETTAALPNCDALSDHSLGALVSLVYNRGPSFRLTSDRYREMRAIRLHMVQKNFAAIPGDIRAMQRIWEGLPNMAGLLRRRELEAQLFELGSSS